MAPLSVLLLLVSFLFHCSCTPTPPSSPFTSFSFLDSSATPVDVSGIDCAIRELAVSFAGSLTYSSATAVFDALQLAGLCNATRPDVEKRPFPSRRREVHEKIMYMSGGWKEEHKKDLSAKAWQRNAQITAARDRVAQGEYAVGDSFIFFVDSASGSDSNAGTMDAPFATIFRALQVLRYSRPTIASSFSYIFLRSSAPHFLSSTLSLGPQDSFTVLSGWDASAAVVSGGIPLRKLAWTAVGGGVYSAAIPAEVNVASDVFNVLYVNGRRAIRARFPDGNPEIQGLYTTPSGWMASAVSWLPRTMGTDLVEIHIQSPNRNGTQFPYFQTGINGPADIFNPKQNFWATSDPPAGGQFYTPGGLVYDPTKFSQKVASWQNTQEAVLSAFHGGYWGQWAFGALSVTPSNNSIQWSYGGFQEARGSSNGANWYVENILAELDNAFEFYVDASSRTLYYYPNSTFPLTGEFIAAQLSTLIAVRGDADLKVDSVILTNLQLTHSSTTWMKPYEAPSGGDVTIYRGGGVLLEGTENVEISYSLFNGISSNAICVSNYNRYTNIRDNEFVWTGDSAIVTLGSTHLMDGHSVPSYPKYTTIENNFIHELGIFTKQVAGVLSSISSFHTIQGNIMFNMPRAAICLNDGFGGGHLLERNLLFNTVRETGDHGPINSWDRQPYVFETDDGSAPTMTPATMRIHNNFLINTYNSVWTIDHDDGSAYYYDSENVLVYGGWKCYLGHSLTAQNNLYVLPDARSGSKAGDWGTYCAQQFGPTPGISGWGNEWADNTCLLANSGVVYDQQNCHEDNLKDVEPWTFNNQFYAPVPVNITCGSNSYTLAEWSAKTGFESGSVEKGMPTVAVVIQLARAMLGL